MAHQPKNKNKTQKTTNKNKPAAKRHASATSNHRTRAKLRHGHTVEHPRQTGTLRPSTPCSPQLSQRVRPQLVQCSLPTVSSHKRSVRGLRLSQETVLYTRFFYDIPPSPARSIHVISGGTRHLARAHSAAQATPHGSRTTPRRGIHEPLPRHAVLFSTNTNAQQTHSQATHLHATPHKHATTPSSRVTAPTPAEQTYIRDKTQIAYRSRLERAAVVLVTRLRTSWNGDPPP